MAAKTPRTLESDSASSSLQAAVKADPNRAFQAINAETLEAASLDVDFPEPPEGTTVSCPCAVLHMKAHLQS